MKEKLLSYLDENFPDLCSDIYILDLNWVNLLKMALMRE